MALCLPAFESLTRRSVRAQNVGLGEPPKRLVVVFFPLGTHAPAWKPTTTGLGDAWNLSPILEPFQNLKSKVTVLSGFENASPMAVEHGKGLAHGLRPGCFLTCVDVEKLVWSGEYQGQDVNGISFDQLIAHHEPYSGQTPLASLELSLGTSNNACDGPPCSFSRNISWQGMTGPNSPERDPVAVFDRLVGAGLQNQPAGPDPLAAQRRALNQSVLDAVMENAATVGAQLGTSDRARMEEFLAAVRASEQRVVEFGNQVSSLVCNPLARPTFSTGFALGNTIEGYSKATHADVMNDLMVMALQCDVTRVITHMMENERSEFVYDHINVRTFSETGSTETATPAGNYHGAQHGSADEFATITRWNALKVAAFCERLDSIEDAPGSSVLDNTLVVFASCMGGQMHRGQDLPVMLAGGLGGSFKTNQHIEFQSPRPLCDLYYTIMNYGFDLGVTDFGNHAAGMPISTIGDLLT